MNTAVSKSILLDQASVRCAITNEYGVLKTALVHRPGPEIDRLTPLNKEELLFEDIPFLGPMQQEHNAFCEIMRGQGAQLFYLEDLVLDLLATPKLRRRLIYETCQAAGQPGVAQAILDYYSEREICTILFSGVTAFELREHTGLDLGSTNPRDDFFILHPIPNAYFSRDPGVIIGNGLVSCKAHYAARVRETLLYRAAFQFHPNFVGCEILYGAAREEDRPFTIEGGDIIVLSEKTVVIGCSQRTRSETIAILAKKLFCSGRAQRVYEVSIPVAREYMHLDTVFTVIAPGVVVAYPDVMNNVLRVRRYEPMLVPGGEIIAFPHEEKRRFNALLEDEFGVRLTVIHTGDNDIRYAAREQGADGTNMLAIAPGKVISYDRNLHTNAAMRAFGIEVLEIAGSELVRGLGGPRCMTMPLERA